VNKKEEININQELRFSVKDFNAFMNQNFDLIGNVIVEGEITQLSISQKGGVNIVIKDEKESAVLNVSGYAPWIEGIKFIKEGMKVQAFGKPNIWSQAGRFSLQIYKILPMGEGALKEVYEKLKADLEKEGLFDLARKRPLPQYVSRIALITAKDSAAESDFLKILRENTNGISIDFYPVQVQGKYSEMEIMSALKSLNYNNYDCIVLIRGGGSLEDLITFNSESIARIIFSLPIPVIVGVGHERDESIADFVADIRASTPSQAAYYIITNNENFIKGMDLILEKIGSFIVNKISGEIINAEQKLSVIDSQFNYKLKIYDNILINSVRALNRLPKEVENAIEKLNNYERLVKSVDPHRVLKRGYSLVTNNDGKIIKDYTQTEVNEKINIKLYRGKLLVNILSKNENEK